MNNLCRTFSSRPFSPEICWLKDPSFWDRNACPYGYISPMQFKLRVPLGQFWNLGTLHQLAHYITILSGVIGANYQGEMGMLLLTMRRRIIYLETIKYSSNSRFSGSCHVWSQSSVMWGLLRTLPGEGGQPVKSAKEWMWVRGVTHIHYGLLASYRKQDWSSSRFLLCQQLSFHRLVWGVLVVFSSELIRPSRVTVSPQWETCHPWGLGFEMDAMIKGLFLGRGWEPFHHTIAGSWHMVAGCCPCSIKRWEWVLCSKGEVLCGPEMPPLDSSSPSDPAQPPLGLIPVVWVPRLLGLCLPQLRDSRRPQQVKGGRCPWAQPPADTLTVTPVFMGYL